MPQFGAASETQLATVHPNLQRVLREAIKHFDFTVVEGHRNEADQEKAFATGKTKLHYPNGNHNATPSNAADCMPFPIDWSDAVVAQQRICVMAGVILCCARQLGIPVRWGGDWNRNDDTRDEHFRDLDHFELDQHPSGSTEL